MTNVTACISALWEKADVLAVPGISIDRIKRFRTVLQYGVEYSRLAHVISFNGDSSWNISFAMTQTMTYIETQKESGLENMQALKSPTFY